ERAVSSANCEACPIARNGKRDDAAYLTFENHLLPGRQLPRDHLSISTSRKNSPSIRGKYDSSLQLSLRSLRTNLPPRLNVAARHSIDVIKKDQLRPIRRKAGCKKIGDSEA